ncbi:matrix metalloproteinase-16 isoform X2 [Folsomia candida]|uniref:Matrix metalloproteinase-16 n=1 Tax=Folsomia candida TaxID=158441 RepID=A0A226D8D4_FOLCA|nr:matrix metalloproteinase-16 isoform X2 [Folsomia candida]OXA40516.1 Matrix metalloproteinase-16 [Folsomia candida]
MNRMIPKWRCVLLDKKLVVTNLSLFLASVLTCSVMLAAAPVKNNNNENGHAMMYLMQYGWLDPAAKKVGSTASLVDLRKPIEEFQSFAGLNVTGELDDETIELMNTPRCGVRDKIGHDARRRKRYVLQGSRWKVRELSYRIEKYPTVAKSVGEKAIDAEVAQAFKVWEDHANLVFTKKTSGKVHIAIRFETGEHGDGDPFDGEGGTLAHAYFPVYGGDAHFDNAERWTLKSYSGTNLFQVAAHEFGHSLGLSHSDKRAALMAPFYRGYKPSFVLDEDDIQGIQSLYGKKTTASRPGSNPEAQVPPVKPPPPPVKGSSSSSSNSKLCNDPKIDAITAMADGSTYAFKGEEVYKLTDNGIAPGYPQRIKAIFKDLPSYLDAAFTWSNDKTYFFKGSKYWRYTDLTLDSGYPKAITEGFAGVPESIDTAFVWSGNGKIYFFKGDKYWRFDPHKDPPIGGGYPKPIDNWTGIPNNVNAALRYSNGYTYFFKGKDYYRFNDRTFQVDLADPTFPRPSGEWWYGCGKRDMKSDKSPSDYQEDSSSDDTGEYDLGEPRDFHERVPTTTKGPTVTTAKRPAWWKRMWNWVTG